MTHLYKYISNKWKEKQRSGKNSFHVLVQSWYKLFFFSNYDNLWRMIRRIVTVDLRRILVTRINKQGNKKNVALDEKIYARYARDNRLPRDPWKSSLESFFPSRPTSMKKGSPSKIFFVRPSLTLLNYRRPLFSLSSRGIDPRLDRDQRHWYSERRGVQRTN